MGFSNQSSKPAEQINKIFAKGSEWRVWDLHIHTPGTAKNDQYGKDSSAWESYIVHSREELKPTLCKCASKKLK